MAVFGGTAAAREVARSVDQPDMRERLREVSNQPSRHWIVLLRQQAHVVAQRQELFEDLGGLVVAALEREVVGQPERAEQEGALSRREPVDLRRREVAGHEAVRAKPALD